MLHSAGIYGERCTAKNRYGRGAIRNTMELCVNAHIVIEKSIIGIYAGDAAGIYLIMVRAHIIQSAVPCCSMHWLSAGEKRFDASK